MINYKQCSKCNGYGKVKYIDLFTILQEQYWVDCPECKKARGKANKVAK